MKNFFTSTALLVPSLCLRSCDAWIPSLPTSRNDFSLYSLSDENIVSTALPKDESIWKAEGERVILEAATTCGANEKDVDIQWKPGRIIVTISGDTFIEAKSKEDDEDAEIEYDDEIDQNALEEFDSEFNAVEGDDDKKEEPEFGNDIVSIARKINYLLGEEGEGSVAYNIAVHHEIEVTTPGASDELEGIMFEAYRGFDVIVEALDPKKEGKVQVIEGKLVDRDEKKTTVNVKGRMRKIKNDLILTVKLPKAKREKGVK